MKLLGKVMGFTGIAILLSGLTAQAQMIDNTQAPNTAGAASTSPFRTRSGPAAAMC